METIDYLKIMSEEIHSVVIATTDEKGLPATRVIDMMLYDEEGLYFQTAKGKSFYRQLCQFPYISLTGIRGRGPTMDRIALSFSGVVKNIGTDRLDEIFPKNPYMAQIYPGSESREALEVFRIYRGRGQYFDLTTKPITRCSFALGEKVTEDYAYKITAACMACGTCSGVCPQNCIVPGNPYRIEESHCLRCGNCAARCPEKAIVRTDPI